MRRRLGFTAYELLIVIAILAIIIALLLPALQRARESARQMNCRGNLSKIVLAMHNYHEAHKTFPPGIVASNVPGVSNCIYSVRAKSQECNYPNATSTSGFTQILPYLEHRVTYNLYNFRLASCSNSNTTSTGQVVTEFVCPSNERGTTSILRAYYVGGDAAPTDYAFNLGNNSLLTCAPPLSLNQMKSGYPVTFRRGAGPFNVNFGASQRYFSDGMSQTFLLGEVSGGAQLTIAAPIVFDHDTVAGTGIEDIALAIDQPWSQGYIGNNYTGGSGSVFAATAFDHWYDPNKNGAMAKPGPSPGYTPLKLNMGKLRWMRRTSYAMSLPNGLAVANPNGKPVEFDSVRFSMSSFRSYHNASACFAFADGSVQVINENIDPRVYNAMASVAGGDEVE